MKLHRLGFIAVVLLAVLGWHAFAQKGNQNQQGNNNQGGTKDKVDVDNNDPVIQNIAAKIAEGRETFRFDTFGDEAFWGDTLQLHRAIAGSANGGVGTGVSPQTALSLGLKVDVNALPQPLQ